jgi:hypothetical protein
MRWLELSLSHGLFRDALHALHGEKPPLLWHALKHVGATFDEADARPSHKVSDRARHEDFARRRQGADPSSDVHGYPSEIVAANLALPGMHSRPDFQVQRSNLSCDGSCASDRSCRSVKAGDESVTYRLDLSAPK